MRSRSAPSHNDHRSNRSRSNTAHSYNDRFAPKEDTVPELEPLRPSIRSQTRGSSRISTIDIHEDSPRSSPSRKPASIRSSTFQGPTALKESPVEFSPARQTSIPPSVGQLRANLRPTNRITTTPADTFGDPSDESLSSASPENYSHRERSVSPATSHGSVASRTASYTGGATDRRKAPPPPPNRAKKPAPPPPMKRADISATSVNRY